MARLYDWQDYDGNDVLHVLSLGAGRQSSVMYLMADCGEITPRPHCAIFADTGNEPEWVYDQLDYLKTVGSIPIHVVSNGNIYEDAKAALENPEKSPWGAYRWDGFPTFAEGGGPLKRKCTERYKIKPAKAEMRRLLKMAGKKYVIDWRGHTIDEIHRAKPEKPKYHLVRWPLLENRISDAECAAWAKRNGHPEFKWSACELCPFRLSQWERAQELMSNPHRAKRIIEMDQAVRDLSKFGITSPQFFVASYIPVHQFVEEDHRNRQMSLFECDGGACGL